MTAAAAGAQIAGRGSRIHRTGGPMRRTILPLPMLVAAVALAIGVRAWSYPDFARQTKLACATCHANPAGGADLTEAGKAFGLDKAKVPKKSAAGAEYTGSNKCRICHLPQY